MTHLSVRARGSEVHGHSDDDAEHTGVVAWGDRVVATGTRIDVALSLHSYGRMILHAFGGLGRAPAGVAKLRAAARAVAARIPGPYRVVQVARWAFAHGIEVDTRHSRWGAVALPVECSAGAISLGAPSSLVHPLRWFNPADPRADVEESRPGSTPSFAAASCHNERLERGSSHACVRELADDRGPLRGRGLRLFGRA